MMDWKNFLSRTSGKRGPNLTDYATYIYLLLGTLLMFGPVLWMVVSSFKTEAALIEFPPQLLPQQPVMIDVEGYDEPLRLVDVTFEDGTTSRLAVARQTSRSTQLVDPAVPDETIQARIADVQIEPVRELRFQWQNYVEPIQAPDFLSPWVEETISNLQRDLLDEEPQGQFDFFRYFANSLLVTVVATALTLLINSMAAFALSKYKFRGRDAIFVTFIATLMIPISVILVPVFLVITSIGWSNNLLGIIVPGAATPTGVFLLRQYMLTIPDELMDSARIDGASEWRIYWQIILPLARPALAVLAIFSVMWRWNDFLWPLIVLTRKEFFTLQVGLNSFNGELNTPEHYVLAMTVVTLLPITLVFAILQRFITTGIATTGMK